MKNAEKKPKQKRPAHRLMLLVTVLCAASLAVGLFFSVRYLINAAFVHDYRNEIYNEQTEEPLLTLNFVEAYIPYYNIANVCYQKEEYDTAIAFYREALEMGIPHGKECPVRVNLALSMLQKIDFSDLSTTKQIESAIRQLLAARGVLIEDGCANPDDDQGHSPEAEQLKKDIDEMLEKLREMLENPPEQQQQQQQMSGDQQDQQQQQQGQSQQEQQIQQQLQEQMQQAMQEHTDAENNYQYGGYDEYGEGGSGGSGGAMW